jgi:tetratricopeptide (TPR) repeat protein
VNNKYKYKAYISYSHCDERWASWLHRALESYRIPRKLVGTKTGMGEVSSRIKPVFRDRDDLSSASDLGGTVKQALSDSENMIVICSPEAAASHWVNEEIRVFASLGRKKQIFCVIVDGEPGGVGTASTCFPAALEEIGLQEPLAADVRKWADGKHLSKLKLVAGILGLSLDQLRRRDLQKRQRVWALAAVASIAVAAVLVTAVTARIAAQQRRDSGELLVGYKLNELRTMLNVADDPGDLSRLREWNQQELAFLIANAGEEEGALTISAMNLRDEGIRLWRDSALGLAMDKFQKSWALLAETYRRDNSDYMAFFELGQAEFWIGQVYTDLGSLEAAEDSFISYAEITRQLILLQPKNAEWVLEMAYALTNLGVLEKDRDANNPERSLQLMQSALEYNQIALVLDPQNELYKSELGQSHAFFADAQLGVCDLEGAFQSRLDNVALEQDILAADSENILKMEKLAWAFSGLTVVQDQMGHVDDAIESLEKVLQLMEPVFLQNPDDKKIIRYILHRKRLLVLLKAIAGKIDNAFQAMEILDEEWRLFFQDGVKEDFNAIESYQAFLLNWARLAQIEGKLETAGLLLEDSMTRIAETLQISPGNRIAENRLMLAVFLYWELNYELPPETVMALLPDYRSNRGRTRACTDASMAVYKAVMLGQQTQARELTEYLIERGYREAGFMRVCRRYNLCSGQ